MAVPNPLTTPGKEHPAHEKLTRRDITLNLIGAALIILYLDSLATIALGFLYGPAVGAMTGIVTNIIWGLTINPTTIPFAAGPAALGLLAGLAGRYGLTKKLWAIIPAGFTTGIIAGLIGAPVAAFVYGGGQ